MTGPRYSPKEMRGSVHAVEPEEILGVLGSTPEQGLSNDEVEKRRERHGPNQLREAKRRSTWGLLLDQGRSVVLIVLLMATYHRSDDGFEVAVKGAPAAVLEACDHVAGAKHDEALDRSRRDQWLERASNLAGQGLRLLAMADKKVDSIDSGPYQRLRFVGIVGMEDPPRPRVSEAIKKCQSAGIRIIMVTGDQPETAAAIGRQVGLVGESGELDVVHGREIEELDRLSDEQRRRLMKANVFARVTPEQKLALLSIYQDHGETVAMTGDGVNDAPTLKKANIGVAMGRRGTDAARHQRERQLLLDRLNAKEEIAAPAAREYKETDVTYTAVRRQLAQEWDAALAAVETERTRLATFDKRRPSMLTPQQQRQLECLSTDLRRIWNHPRATTVLKKQIVRSLVREIVADVEDDEIVLIIHWAGGHHTELREPRRSRISRRQLEDVKKVIDTLRKLLTDEQIAVALNRERLWQPRGPRKDKTWTGRHVTAFRRQHRIPGFSAKTKQDEGWLTQAEAANKLNISAMSMTRLIRAGIVPAEQPHPGLPTVVRGKDLGRDGVRMAIARLKASGNRPLTDDPNQLSLFK